jgi:hypothetical protein
MPRRWWTGRELKQVKEYAEEGLSIGRTASLIGRTRASLGAAASRYKIEFHGEYGAPFDNKNRLGKKKKQTREEILVKQRERMARYRKRKTTGKVRGLSKSVFNKKQRRYKRIKKLNKWSDSAE